MVQDKPSKEYLNNDDEEGEEEEDADVGLDVGKKGILDEAPKVVGTTANYSVVEDKVICTVESRLGLMRPSAPSNRAFLPCPAT
jgi:hypothetical protein